MSAALTVSSDWPFKIRQRMERVPLLGAGELKENIANMQSNRFSRSPAGMVEDVIMTGSLMSLNCDG